MSLSQQGLDDINIYVDTKHKQPYRFCENHQHEVCNWLIPLDEDNTLCKACEFNGVIPNIDSIENRNYWQEIEVAKHRLIYSLIQFGLSLESKCDLPETGLSFEFLEDNVSIDNEQAVMTGHSNGTININEANSVHRESAKDDMDESYRTLIGHFRHEVGHYYWDRLVRQDKKSLQDYRELFGDERVDYMQSLERHYKDGAKADWNEYFIST